MHRPKCPSMARGTAGDWCISRPRIPCATGVAEWSGNYLGGLFLCWEKLIQTESPTENSSLKLLGVRNSIWKGIMWSTSNWNFTDLKVLSHVHYLCKKVSLAVLQSPGLIVVLGPEIFFLWLWKCWICVAKGCLLDETTVMANVLTNPSCSHI